MIYKERASNDTILIVNEATTQSFVRFVRIGYTESIPTVYRMRIDDFHRKYKPFGVEREVDIISGKEVEVCDGHYFA